MALIIVFTFLAMIMFGGIAVDVMRFETRRVTMQQTLDRAALASASLDQTRTPEQIAADWFNKAGIGEDLAMVDFSAPSVTSLADAGQRRVTMSASVRSYNFFMGIYSKNDYLEGPTTAAAAQGVSQIEVMLVLDITGSMGDPIGGGKSKIQALREAATDFVNIVKANDTKNGVSIGMVPYAAQVNIPVNLRNQFTAWNISTWDGVANAGVPNIDCMELPTTSYGDTALSQTSPIRMSAVADSNTGTTTSDAFIAPSVGVPNAGTRACTTVPDNTATARNEATANQIVMPTKDGEILKQRIAGLVAAGNTNIAIGMRWGVGLIDQAARPIYTAIGDPSVLGRPADNNSTQTRKIIILMTDGTHVTNTHIKDNYKSGASPIWRGTDGNYAIRFWSGGTDLNDNARPTSCMGWTIPASAGREFFLPHMKDTQERDRGTATATNEGLGTGTLRTLANTGSYNCDPNSWIAAGPGGVVRWPHTQADGSDPDDERDIVLNSSGQPVMITATQLDWSEVWRYLTVSYVTRQLYMRSGVSGTSNYNTVMDLMRGTYMSSVNNLNSLLQQNCAAARVAGIEIYGIAFAAPAGGQAQINGCASEPKITYYYNAADSAALTAAFNEIATDISDLRLTQ
ncbi:TadE/TadG family type IV pilus assembly protein [Tabrizicola piscis]|nr:Tad domain-containing protein [Tabrizicola piscis]